MVIDFDDLCGLCFIGPESYATMRVCPPASRIVMPGITNSDPTDDVLDGMEDGIINQPDVYRAERYEGPELSRYLRNVFERLLTEVQ